MNETSIDFIRPVHLQVRVKDKNKKQLETVNLSSRYTHQDLENDLYDDTQTRNAQNEQNETAEEEN